MPIPSSRSSPSARLQLLSRFRRDRRGVAFVEFAFIAPILVLLFFGTVEVSDAIMADRRVTKVTSSVADLVARAPRTGLSCAQVNDILEIADVLIQPYNPAELSITIHTMQTTNDAGTSYNWKWTKHNGKGTPAPAPTTMPSGLSRTKDEQVVVVQVAYPYQGNITQYLLKTRLQLGETFYLKPRQGTADITGQSPSAFNYSCP